MLLADKGVNPESKDKYDRTPLSWVAASWHGMVVKLPLAENGLRARRIKRIEPRSLGQQRTGMRL